MNDDSEKLAILRLELALTIRSYNEALVDADKVLARIVFKASHDMAGKAFEYQQEADSIRATSTKPMAEIEARFKEIAADSFRDLSRDLSQMAESMPLLSQSAAINL